MTHKWLPLMTMFVVGGIIGAYTMLSFFSDEAERENIATTTERWPEKQQAKRQIVADPGQLVAQFDSLHEILDEEVEERHRLQKAVANIQRELDMIRKVAPGLFASAEVDNGSTNAAPENRQDRFVSAGFDEAQAIDLQRREDEFAMQELSLRDRASREKWINTSRYGEEFREIRKNRYSIRDELGDEDYDRYLYAVGEPNRIFVAKVLDTSPAQQAGLERGDSILSYNGKKVFSLRELSALTMQGSAGESVPLSVLRGGQQMQIWIPRGPIGFQSSGGSVNPNEQN